MANARLGWFSPLGLAASIRASARRVGLGLTASAFRHAPLRSGRWASSFFRLPLRRLPSAGWPSGSPLPLFGMRRFGDCRRASSFFRLPVRRLPLGRLAFGLTASAFWHALIRKLPSAGWFFRWAGWPSGSLLPLFGTHCFGVAVRRVGLRVHCFRFSACTASELPSASWPSGSPLPLFGMHRFGVAVRRVALRAHCFRFSARTDSEIALGGLAFGLTASAFRHALLRRLPSAG